MTATASRVGGGGHASISQTFEQQRPEEDMLSEEKKTVGKTVRSRRKMDNEADTQ